ncbi:MAG: hypothetical protein IJK78_05765 [Bacteroidales bacterium]|nr:hypothetical protein [Bacteroidales bacterium]
MKKLAFVVLLLFPTLALAQSPYELRARYVAEDYYNWLHRIAEMCSYNELAYSDQAVTLELQLLDLVVQYEGESLATDIRIPNDIDSIFGSSRKNKYTDVTISNYVGRFREYAVQNKFGFTYEVISCKQLEAPTLRGGEDEARWVEVVVNKKFRWNRKTIKVKDTMLVSFFNGNASITSIKNTYNTTNPSPY